MKKLLLRVTQVACVLVLPVMLLRAQQACDGTTVSGDVPTYHCAAGVTEEQAYDNAYYGYPGVPTCAVCETEGEVCSQELRLYYHPGEYSKRCFQVPTTGVWICCIQLGAGAKFKNTCECVEP